MKSLFSVALALLVLCAPTFAEESALKTKEQKIGYAIGIIMSKQLGPAGKHADKEALVKGLQDGLAGGKTILSDEEMQAALESLQAAITKEQSAAAAEKGKFLEANKSKPGVKTTASGLQYKVIKEGVGNAPKADDIVEVHYKGTLTDGTEFDSSYSRGEPATFPVNRVIPGWTEALQLMKEGSKYELYIPSNLAYGERGAGDKIGPNEPLVFEVELIKIKDKAAATK